MKKISPHKLSWFLLFVLIAIVCLVRWHALSLPYFWDEMGVYAYGVNYMFEHGISLLPKDLPPDISRGHPLLIFGLYASFFKIFGNSLFAAHSLALIISTFTLLASYRLARFFTPPLVAFFAAVILASQNIFLAQSTLVLPEMLVALLSVLAFNSYFRKKIFWCALFLCIGVLIKESMIITAGFMGLVYLLQAISSRTFKKSLPNILKFTAPLIVLVAFLVIQKAQNGWYFFPYHTELISEGVLAGLKNKLGNHLIFTFYAQGRILWLPILILLGIAGSLASKHRKELVILIVFSVYSLFVFSLAFYMDRYLLYLFPLLCVLLVSGIYSVLKESFFSWFILSVLCFCGILHSALAPSGFKYDVNVNYSLVIDIHQQSVDDLCEVSGLISPNEKLVVYANFPINMSLWESFFGYADQGCLSKIVIVNNPKEANYMLLFHELHTGVDDVKMSNAISNKVYANSVGSIAVYQKIISSEEWAQFDNSLFLEENNKD